jgi:hypothetical protein
MSKKLTLEEFIHKSNSVHKNFYDYSNVLYTKNNKYKISIICPIHGTFFQTPNDHLGGHGCAKCKNVHVSSSEEFKNKANKKHNNIYNYSKVNYKNAKTPIIIICKKHGEFLQIPNYHLCGNGCKKCAYEKNLNKNYSVSNKEIDFLNYYYIVERNKYIGGYYVDGFDTSTNTIYEFLGDYWHGNPETFFPHEINKSLGKTFGELYKHTFIRFNHLKDNGYIIKYIWENDWKKFRKKINKKPKIQIYE